MAEEPTETQADAQPKRDWRTAGLLAVILAVGLALRLWGIGWSLPDARHPASTYHPDELVNLAAARAADPFRGQFDIPFYNYGTLYFYLVSVAHTIGRGYGAIPTTPQPPAGQILSEQEQLIAGAPEQAALFLWGRLVTALLGTATIWALFALGNRLFGKAAGLLAALLYALAPLAVVHAHFLTVDVPATFFVTLTLLWAARLLTVNAKTACALPKTGPSPSALISPDDLRGWREYVLAGVFAGLAAATKYTAGLALIAPITAHFLNNQPGTCKRHRAAQLIVLLAVAAIAFLIACPGPIINLEAFWEGTYPGSGVRYELFEHARTGHGDLFINTGPGWWYHLTVSLRAGLGLPLLLLALGGIALACVRRTRQDWVLLSFLLFYYLANSFSAVRFARYMIPLFPVLCLLAARLVMEPFSRRAAHFLAAAGAGVVVFTAGYTVSLARPMTLRDPRDQAADYLEHNAPPGASVAFAKMPWYFSPPLSPLFGALRADTRARAVTQTPRYQLRIPATEWDPAVLTPPPDYVVLSNLETVNAVNRLRLPGPTRFVETVAQTHTPVVFRPYSRLFGLPIDREGPGIPEDLLYTMPTLTIWKRR